MTKKLPEIMTDEEMEAVLKHSSWAEKAFRAGWEAAEDAHWYQTTWARPKTPIPIEVDEALAEWRAKFPLEDEK